MIGVFRRVPLIAALLGALAVAGCASPGIEPTVSERRTVELPDIPVDKPGILDPAFAPERLRGVDVCGTLRATALEQYGTPAAFRQEGFGTCANYMKNHDGEQFTVTLYFDDGLTDPSSHRIGGLPATVRDNGSGSCFASAAYAGADTRLFEEPRGLTVQLASEQDDVCSPAVQILTDAVDVVRTKPPVNARASGGLAGFDPCQIADPAALRDAMAGGTPDASGGRGLYECTWSAENSVVAKVGLKFGTMDSSDVPPGVPPPPPIDLGGAPTSVVVTPDPPGCAIQWEHRKSGGSSEFVHVAISNMKRVPMDPCVNAANLARQVRAKLPAA